MSRNIISKKLIINNKEVIIETGLLAKQADGAVVVKMGNTMIIATVVSERESQDNIDFLPLSVDYQEKYAASGKIPGGFLKREGRLSDREILISRLVDRVIRPLFPKDYHSAVQISISLISNDPEVMPDTLVALAASSAIAVSDIPISDYVSEVRVSRINSQLVINPTPKENERADIDIIVGATSSNILMVEGEMKEVSEEDMLQAIEFAHQEIKKQCSIQSELAEAVGSLTKRSFQHTIENEELKKLVEDKSYKKIYDLLKTSIKTKKERSLAINNLKLECKKEILDLFKEDNDIKVVLIDKYLNKTEKKASRELLLKEGIRLDGRTTTEIREISSQIDFLPGSHGSAIFTRGETQSLTTVTLGGKMDEQLIDSVMETGTSKFLLHYNFPGFCTGDVKPARGPSRREIGHGNLALRALKYVLPPEEDNLYTIRIVSDILESNGSSSMATVCAGSMALMDSGIKTKKAVAGIAMGLVIDENDPSNYKILSDIIGAEDALGDMDFKVAGTENGITACQMDIKVSGISHEIMRKALEQARAGRIHILNEMNKTIGMSRHDFKPFVPRIEVLRIDEEFIGAVIGPGGKTIQELQKNTDSIITIENIGNKGIVKISAPNKSKIEEAKRFILAISTKPQVGEIYKGKIKAILDFGAFVEFLPGKDGLLHISEVIWDRVDNLKNILRVGQEIEVKLIDIDPKTGKFRLSRKALLPRE